MAEKFSMPLACSMAVEKSISAQVDYANGKKQIAEAQAAQMQADAICFAEVQSYEHRVLMIAEIKKAEVEKLGKDASDKRYPHLLQLAKLGKDTAIEFAKDSDGSIIGFYGKEGKACSMDTKLKMLRESGKDVFTRHEDARKKLAKALEDVEKYTALVAEYRAAMPTQEESK